MPTATEIASVSYDASLNDLYRSGQNVNPLFRIYGNPGLLREGLVQSINLSPADQSGLLAAMIIMAVVFLFFQK